LIPNIHTIPVFTNHIYATNILNVVDKEKALSEIKIGSGVSNKGGWQSEKYTESSLPNSLTFLASSAKSFAQQIYNHLGITDDPKMLNMWLNGSGPTAYNKKHKHPHSYVSVVYYLQVPEGSAPISFFRPDSLSDYFYNIKANQNNMKVFEIDPKEGDLIGFPAYLEHSVDMSSFSENEERISIAMNFR